MRKIIILSIFLSIAFNSYSGVGDTLELTINSELTALYRLDDGLVVVYDEGRKPNKNKIIEHYDTVFNLIKKVDFNIQIDSPGNRPFRTFQLGNNYYLMYYDFKNNIQITTYNLLTNKVEVSPICQLEDKRQAVEFVVLGDFAYITYHTIGFMHYKANLTLFNIKKGGIKIIDLPSETRTQLPLKGISHNKDFNEINVVFQSSLDENSELEIIRFDSLGKRIQPKFYIEEPKSNYFPKPNVLKLNKEAFFITGFSTIKSQKGDPIITNFATSKDDQIFISFYESNKMKWIKYFDYKKISSIKNIYDKEIRFKAPLIEGEHIYFIAEVYRTLYKKVEAYNYMTQDKDKIEQVVDHYEYTHCIVLGFNINTGELDWDIAIPTFVDTKGDRSAIKTIDLKSELVVVAEDSNVLKKLTIDDKGKVSSENLVVLPSRKEKLGYYLLQFGNWYSNYFIEITYTNYKKKGTTDVFTIRKF